MSVQLTLDFSGGTGTHLQVLGSSSAGNCTLVWAGGQALLIDCGFGPRFVTRQLKKVGLSLFSISALIVTHVHSDHVDEQIVGTLSQIGVPVFCPPSVEKHLLHTYPSVRDAGRKGLVKKLKKNECVIGKFGIEAFEVPHDSPGGCFGYSIWDGTKKITIATDLGFPQKHLAERFAGSAAIVIESNHDPDMLENSGRPEWLKKRIRERGHLSNEQCAGLVIDVVRASENVPQVVVVAHISQECNTNALAVGCTERALTQHGFSGIPVLETHKGTPNQIVSLGV